jgi:hypothetical protein
MDKVQKPSNSDLFNSLDVFHKETNGANVRIWLKIKA